MNSMLVNYSREYLSKPVRPGVPLDVSNYIGALVNMKQEIRSSRNGSLIVKRNIGHIVGVSTDNGIRKQVVKLRIQLGREFVYKTISLGDPKFIGLDILEYPRNKK